MSRVLRIIGFSVAAFVLLLAVATGLIYTLTGLELRRTYTVTTWPLQIPTEAGALARGRHLAATRGCLDCHGKDLGGAKVIEDPAMGRMYGSNLTKGRGGVTAGFKDADWVRAISHGVAHDGRGLFLMPSTDYSHFTDDDLGSLVAYVKSVPPVDRETVPIKVGPMARTLLLAGKIKISAEEIDHKMLRPAEVTPGVTVEYGRYVAAACTGCHGMNLSGGKIDVGPPDWPPAANLTPHASGRIAHWSENDFLRAMRTARRPDGSELSPVMPRAFGQMDDGELQAIWIYLKSLPPVAIGVR